jgi:hypothetical protein
MESEMNDLEIEIATIDLLEAENARYIALLRVIVGGEFDPLRALAEAWDMTIPWGRADLEEVLIREMARKALEGTDNGHMDGSND